MESITAFVDNTNQYVTMEAEMMDDDMRDSYSGFSDNEKYANYMEIINTIKFFESNGHISEDWMEENKWRIEKWRDWISDYSDIHPEVTDKAFRKACSDAETVLQYLIQCIRSTKTFDTKVYFILLNKLKYICDSMFEEGELENLMSNMGLQ